MIPDALEPVIPISLLNAYEYCPRRFYYEFVQAEMLVNEFVLDGTVLHEGIDEPGQRMTPDGDAVIRRVPLFSETLGLTGFADLVEAHGGAVTPVEYKHGRAGKWLNDHIQLCAQALCLEERLPDRLSIPGGAIFYFGSRKREQVAFTPELRALTRETIARARALAHAGAIPPPLEGKVAARCADCSLKPLCLPDEVRMLRMKGDPLGHALSD